MLGIKILQLDGTPLSLWDSFGRYGGYGAGIASGLLGFMQIYRDPNRQANHDKISATIVIDIKKAEQSTPLLHNSLDITFFRFYFGISSSTISFNKKVSRSIDKPFLSLLAIVSSLCFIA
jgi:hypothetical protein